MPCLNIPTIGTEIELQKDWTFNLHRESRNAIFWGKRFPTVSMYPHGFYDDIKGEYVEYPPEKVTLKAGTILKVDRIYIRKGKSEFDSITFSIVENSENKKIKGRFWVKLDDANNLYY